LPAVVEQYTAIVSIADKFLGSAPPKTLPAPNRDRRMSTGTRVKSACHLAGERVFFFRCHSDLSAKIAGIGNVFLGTELLDIAEYDLEIYEENPEDHEHHGANWTPGANKIEGTVVGELPIRKDLRLLTEEGYSVNFYLRDSFGSVVILDFMLDSSGNPVR
jgi:hypothetical protein